MALVVLALGVLVAVVGAVGLVVAAPTSRTPTTLRVLGVVIIVGGLVTPLIGVERARMIVAWWATQGSAFLRVWAGVALVVGLFLIYAVVASPAPVRVRT